MVLLLTVSETVDRRVDSIHLFTTRSSDPADPYGSVSFDEVTADLTGPACVGDVDGNGFVSVVDFLALLGQWGGPGTCDFDGNGVDVVDFLALLGKWGPCPE